MVVSVLLDNPIWVGLLVALVVLILFGYILMRRTVSELRGGFQDGQRRE